MERIEISSGKIDLSAIVRHVSQDGVSVELSEGQVPLARIVPLERRHSMAALDRAMREATRLGDDAESFASDVLSVRESLGELDDPWAS